MYSHLEPQAKSGVASRRSSPSAFLDGLRGVAAFFVLLHHISKDAFPWLPWGWGSTRNDVVQYYIFQLPIIRIVHSGPSMVALFFVISGFALSISPLKQIRRRDQTSLSQSLASSVFRRVFRLYLPCLVTTFFMMCAVQMNMAPFPAKRPHEKNIFLEFWVWVLCLWKLLNPFNMSFYLPRYDDNLWTIPAEFRGSMVLYLSILAVARFRLKQRLVVESLITVWLFSYGLWDVCLFPAGLVLAELHLERESQMDPNLPRPSPAESTRRRTRRVRYILPVLLLFLSLHLASAPLNGYDSALGFAWFKYFRSAAWKERDVVDRFIPTLGAPLLVFCVDRSARLRSVFTSSIPSYLGRISFALYLVHGPIRYTWYHPLLRNIMRVMGFDVREPAKEIEDKHGWLKAITWISKIAVDKEKAEKHAAQKADTASLDWRFVLAVAIAWAVVIPATVALADFFSRTVDDGSVALAKKIESRLVDGDIPHSIGDGWQDRTSTPRTPKEWVEGDEGRNKFN